MSLPPPLPEEATPEAPALSWPLAVAAAAAGLIALGLNIAASGTGRGEYDMPYRIGSIVGGTFVTPLICVGLFSIGGKFRNARAQATIVLVVWSLTIMGGLGNLLTRKKAGHSNPDERRNAAFGPLPSFSAPRIASPEGLILGGLRGSRYSEGAAPSDFDLSRGSDRRLIDLIEHSQEERYHAVVAAYAKACAVHDDDDVLALERVRFIERFADSEDVSIESAPDDLTTAVGYLTAHFPDAPGTVLFNLRNFSDPEFEKKAQGYAHLTAEWRSEDRARFLLLRAQAANLKKDHAAVESFGSASFECDPTVACGLLLAEALKSEDKEAESVRILGNAVFSAANPWEKRQEMDMLFDLKQWPRALALYEDIKKKTPKFVENPETAARLAAAGNIDAARSTFAGINIHDWNRAKMARERFAFELSYGSAEQARAAYRDMRSGGIVSDPVLRDRLALFAKHPILGWNWDDFGGLLLTGLLLAGGLAAPLLILLPIHYWSLLRPVNAGAPAVNATGWGLREAWLALGIPVLAHMVGLWWYRPEWVRSWWSKTAREPAFTPEVLLSEQKLIWAALACTLALLFWRFRAWRSLGPGRWGFWMTMGVSLGCAVALRYALGVFILIWPQAAGGDIAAVPSLGRQLCLVMLKEYGPMGLVALVAVVVPILEEVLFRGVFLQAMSTCIPFGVANIVQALAFASLHGNLWLLPFFFVFGLIGGFLVRRSGGLLPSILAHAINNLVACIGLIVMGRRVH
jgi:membrane protease YdiL (CAAX protease family)